MSLKTIVVIAMFLIINAGGAAALVTSTTARVSALEEFQRNSAVLPERVATLEANYENIQKTLARIENKMDQK